MRHLLVAKAERMLGDKELGRENRCLGNYEKLKGKLYNRKRHVGKEDREMGRGRKILWKDFPGHFATRSVPKSDRQATQEKQFIRAGQWEKHRMDA